MRLASRKFRRFPIAIAAVFAAATTASALEPPPAPTVSTFAPVEDVTFQIEAYVARLEKSVECEDVFQEAQAKVGMDSNTLILLALAAGLHNEDSKFKAAAPAIVKAAQELAKAKDYLAAKAGVVGVKKALASRDGNAAEMKWAKAASLGDLMKQTPVLNSRLRRNLLRGQLTSKENAGDSATLAVIAQGSLADTSEAKSDEGVRQWRSCCTKLRDAAAALNKAVHKGDKAAADTAMDALNRSCNDCHAVFHRSTEKE